jgi:catechol 2,3-dioxygenase-like lactoylglutathione lyase family enzyme
MSSAEVEMPADAMGGAPRISHILETALYVADLDAAQAFYERLMGFELHLRDGRMAALGVPGGGVLLLFRHGGSVLASSTPFGVIPGHDGRGTLHLAFGVPRGELARWEAHLAAAGVAVESRVNWARGGTSLYFRDPDGHSVEVATPGVWPNF